MISMKRARAAVAVAAITAAAVFSGINGGGSALAISPLHSRIKHRDRGSCVANSALTIYKLPNEASRTRGTLAAGRKVKRGKVLGGWMKVSRGWVMMSGLTCS